MLCVAMPYVRKKRYVVAMSGGVDSSVAAAMMVAAGHEVIGVTLQLAPYRQHGRPGSCCAGADIDDARFVAQKLNIPHYVLDFERSFKKHVIDDFTHSYMNGATPLPCVRCNQRIKFKDLLCLSRRLGADKLVTGHYAQITDNRLHRAKDKKRDQSYFLFATSHKDLPFLHFPLGDKLKIEVRAYAKKHKLPNADKAESQDLCFVHDNSYMETLRKLNPEAGQKGDIIHMDGTFLAHHDGIERFTIGQRRGLDIGGRMSDAQERLYVVKIDASSKTVIVGPKEALACQTIHLQDINWLADDRPTTSMQLNVQWRSQQTPFDATLQLTQNDKAYVTLPHDAYGIAPGQACVFYQREHMLGGGWISPLSS